MANISDQTAAAIKKVRKLLCPAWYLPNGTMNATDDELENASSSCELWSICCGALVLISVAAELVIALAKPEYGLFLKLSAPTDAGVAIGIVGEVFFSMKDARIQTELRRRSNEQLASARLEIDRLATPRFKLLTAENAEKIVERISPFSGTTFAIGHARSGREHWDFLWLLEPLFSKAGWVFLDWNPGPLPHGGNFPKLNWTMQRRVYGVANVSNVDIELSPEHREQLLPAATALVEVLNDVGIAAEITPTLISGISANKDAIHVLVGEKE